MPTLLQSFRLHILSGLGGISEKLPPQRQQRLRIKPARYPKKVTEPIPNPVPVGLCADCQHSRQITSERGATFWMCQRSFTDPDFPKYPRLPVTQCSGFEQKHDTVKS